MSGSFSGKIIDEAVGAIDIRELNDAYSAGYDGPMQGLCVTDNPYERGTALYREWSQGYMTRREELAE